MKPAYGKLLLVFCLASLTACDTADFSGASAQAKAPAAPEKDTTAKPASGPAGVPSGNAENSSKAENDAGVTGDSPNGSASAGYLGSAAGPTQTFAGPGDTGGDQPLSVTPAGINNPSTSPAAPSPPSLPPNAVTKGDFTVYSVPADPDVDEDYQLFILVNLPAGTTSYQQSDLSGTINGTDGWAQSVTQSLKIGSEGDPNAVACSAGGWSGTCDAFPVSFSVTGPTAQMVIWVPGAAWRGVQDTVHITSALLSESQSIQVLFQ